MRKIQNRISTSSFGLVIDWSFHRRHQWVSAFTPYFVHAVLEAFRPLIITTQEEYSYYKWQLKSIISMEPGWGAPLITFDTAVGHLIAMMASDPHNKTAWFQEHIIANNVTYVLSQYNTPFFYHFPGFPQERFVHFPWAFPDQCISDKPLMVRSGDIVIFGASGGAAYDVRDWCRQQSGVVAYDNSGVLNKKLTDRSYFDWLQNFDAIIAAGSSDPSFDLVTPKYFEIAASGALLVGQCCNDLELLGFNENNALLFTKDTFNDVLRSYAAAPEAYLPIRDNGRQLIVERHLISHRISMLRELLR